MKEDRIVIIPDDLKNAIGLTRNFCNVLVEGGRVFCDDERTKGGCRVWPFGGCCLRNTTPNISAPMIRINQEGMELS